MQKPAVVSEILLFGGNGQSCALLAFSGTDSCFLVGLGLTAACEQAVDIVFGH